MSSAPTTTTATTTTTTEPEDVDEHGPAWLSTDFDDR